MDAKHRLSAMIDEHRNGIVALCSDLIRISSENPPGDTRGLARFVEGYLKSESIECRIYAPQEDMPNLVALVKGAGPGRRLVYNGHLDTYPVGDSARWTVEPLGGRVIDGRIYGRGASDMKGGVTASIISFILLARIRQAFRGELVLTLVSDEETGGIWGTRWLLDHVPEVTGDAMINGEPTSCAQVSFAEKGRLFLEFEARGKGAHGAYTHIGVNAIRMMMGLLQDLDGLVNLDIGIPDDVHRVLEQGRTVVDAMKGDGATDVLLGITVNFGTIHGGLNVNTIPESCQTRVDIRLPQGVGCDRVLGEVDRLLGRHSGISYRILQAMEPNYTPPDHEICRLLRETAEIAQGAPVILSSSIGGSDAKHFRKKGIPCALYGPRSYNMAGTDEHITVEDLILTAKAHAMASLDYLSLGS
jgi:succinyl-diaminopimelate desuccinylase